MQAPPGGAGNHRNGSTLEDAADRARAGRGRARRATAGPFEPQLVKKRQTRLAGLDDRVLGLYAGGMSVRDIARHLSELYGTEIGRDTISRVTDAVLEDIQAWRTRPLAAVYPIVYFDCLMVRVREDRSVSPRRACYLAIGQTVDGDREVLGIWWQQTEGAKFWLAVLNDLHQRGVADVLIACVDGLTGFPEAIEAVFPQAWVQTCIVHQVRASLRYVTYTERKKVAADLRRVYAAANVDAAEHELAAFEAKWGGRYPMIAESWRQRWEYLTPFLALPADLRRVVYTTNSIENLNRQVRKAIKTRGHFPDEQAATKLARAAPAFRARTACRAWSATWPGCRSSRRSRRPARSRAGRRTGRRSRPCAARTPPGRSRSSPSSRSGAA